MVPTDDATTAEGETMGTRAEEVADTAGSRLERMGLRRTTGGLLLVTAGVLVLAMPEVLTYVVGVGSILLGVLVLSTVGEDTL